MKSEPENGEKSLRKDTVLLGVLIDRSYSVWKLGKRSGFLYREMSQTAQEHQILLFFFFAKDVDWENKRAVGYCFYRQGWQRRIFPLPKIIYNRIVERSWEKRPVNQEFLRKVCKQPDMKLFNTGFFDKYEVFQALQQYPEIRPYLPQTAAGSPENLRSLIRQHDSLYMKPVDGSKGKGIVRIDRTKEGDFHIRQAGNGRTLTRLSGEDHLLEWFEKFRIPLESCILQQTIPLAEYQQQPFDIRALAQKNGQGQWVFVGAAARIAAKDHLVTHVVNGGKRAALEKVTTADPALKKQRAQIREKLRWLCPLLAQLLEKQIPLHWGIIAFDMALSPDGRLYLLEANSRPGSYSESAIRRRSLSYLMAYCRYLAEGEEKQ